MPFGQVDCVINQTHLPKGYLKFRSQLHDIQRVIK